jgi:hypothetical protein
MEEKVEVKQITLKIGEVETVLSPKQANELRKILNDMFAGVEKEIVTIPYPVPYYPTYPHYPYETWYISKYSTTASLVLK